MRNAVVLFVVQLLRLRDFIRRLRATGKAARFAFKIGLPRPKDRRNSTMEITITSEQKIPLTLSPVTSAGNAAKLDGKPTWEQVDGDASVEVSEDGLTATLVSGELPGESNFLVKADADLGEGVEEISESIKLIVTGAKATNLGLSVGEAVAK